MDEGEVATTHSYWGGLPFPCHKDCKVSGEKDEALECQTIDADCNDCKHYKRGKISPLHREMVKRIDGTMYELTFQNDLFVGGHCLKFNKEVNAQPKKWSGLECFEHRRAVKK